MANSWEFANLLVELYFGNLVDILVAFDIQREAGIRFKGLQAPVSDACGAIVPLTRQKLPNSGILREKGAPYGV